MNHMVKHISTKMLNTEEVKEEYISEKTKTKPQKKETT